MKNKIINFIGRLEGDYQNQNIFLKTFISIFAPYPTEGIVGKNEINAEILEKAIGEVDLEKMKKIKSIDELFDFSLNYLENCLLDKASFTSISMLFSVITKGVTIDEILRICGITIKDWKLYLSVFKSFIMNYDTIWIANNEFFKNALIRKYHQSKEALIDFHFHVA